jgi:hypothetical protein
MNEDGGSIGILRMFTLIITRGLRYLPDHVGRK